MNENSTGQRTVSVGSVGHGVFAATMIGLGIEGLIKRDFAPIWEPVPETLPARALLIYLCAFVALASGIGLLLRRTVADAARLLLAYLLLWLWLLRVPHIFISPTLDVWYSSCQTLVVVAAAWVLHAGFPTDRDRQRFAVATGDAGVRIARVLYGVSLIPFGLAHVIYLQATAPLVPDWLPAHTAWAYLTGATFVAAGLAVLVGVYARLAAALSALQIGLFTLLVWVPIVASGAANAAQWGEFVVSWTLTACAWVVADSYRNMSWLAVGKR